MPRILQLLPGARRLIALAIVFSWAAPGFAQEAPPVSPSPGPVTSNASASGSPVSAAAGTRSKQLKVTSEDPNTQLAFSTFADTVDRNFRQLTKDGSDWVFPIKVTIKGTVADLDFSGPATASQIELSPNGQFTLQLWIRLSSNFRREESVRGLIRILILERMLRAFQSEPEKVADKLEIPVWLLYGVEQLIAHHQAGRPSDFYAGIVQSRQVLSAREILSGDPSKLDSLSAAVFEASSAALVAALLDQPQGHQHFQEFLGNLAGTDPGDIEPLIRQHFPGLRGSAGALEKWWSLQIAYMGQRQAFEFISVEQTEVLLEEALAVRFGVEPVEEPKGLGKFLPKLKPGQPFVGRIHDFEEFIGRKDAPKVLGQTHVKLRSLSMRCFPLYRNVVARYEAVVLLLLDDRKRGLSKELNAIDQARAGIGETMSRVADFMNYYEATQAEGKSEAFENYRKTRKKIERRGRPERNDRISRYLDALEVEFEEVNQP